MSCFRRSWSPSAKVTAPRIWLLLTAVWATYPTSSDVLEAARFMRLSSPRQAFIWLLDRRLERDYASAAEFELEVVSDRVVVDVDHTARADLHTGIQQVVRRTLPHWVSDKPVLPVAWTEESRAWRSLSTMEERRLLDWDNHPQSEPSSRPDPDVATAATVVVPWQTVVVLPEVPLIQPCERLAALAELSGNRVVLIGYDCIPVVSADMMPREVPSASPNTCRS